MVTYQHQCSIRYQMTIACLQFSLGSAAEDPYERIRGDIVFKYMDLLADYNVPMLLRV